MANKSDSGITHIKRRIYAAMTLEELNDVLDTVADNYRQSREVINAAAMKKQDLIDRLKERR